MVVFLFSHILAVDVKWPKDDKQPDQLMKHSIPREEDEDAAAHKPSASTNLKRVAPHDGSFSDSTPKRLHTTPDSQA